MDYKLVKKIGNKIVHLQAKLLVYLVKIKAYNLAFMLPYSALHELRFDKEKYLLCKNSLNIESISRCISEKKIKLVYILYTGSMWSCQEMYEKFAEDERFSQTVVIVHKDGGNDFEYDETIKTLKTKNINVTGVDDGGKKIIKDADIIVYLYPYEVYPAFVDFPNLKLSKLIIYIPYGFHLANIEGKYNNFMHINSWKFYADTRAYKELMAKNCFVGDSHIFYVGYPKMDIFYSGRRLECKLWRPDSNKKQVKIVYAPHYSVASDDSVKFATFGDNYRLLLELAKKYKEQTSWIVKPHPLLRKTAVKAGIFNSEKEYNEYLKEWINIGNVSVVESGTYMDIFETSDAMILDSISFLMEYQYVHKPLLLLGNNNQNFLEIGNELMKVLYRCDGDDIESIESFIEEVVIRQKDKMKEDRENFFSEQIDYYKANGYRTASEAIYDDIAAAFEQ